MRNIDVYTEKEGLTEKIVEEIAKDKAAEVVPEQDPEVLLKELLSSAPRKLKRKIAPERKFAATFLEKMRNKRKESK